jgi:hypothetical protein
MDKETCFERSKGLKFVARFSFPLASAREALSTAWSSSISRFHFWRPRPTVVRPLSFPPCVCASGAFARWGSVPARNAIARSARALSIRATLIMPGCNLHENTRIRESRAIIAAIGLPNCTSIARMSRDSAQISARCLDRFRVLMSRCVIRALRNISTTVHLFRPVYLSSRTLLELFQAHDSNEREQISQGEFLSRTLARSLTDVLHNVHHARDHLEIARLRSVFTAKRRN